MDSFGGGGEWMSITGDTPQARPLFRKLALGMALVCFVLALVLGIAPIEDKLLAAGSCLFVGFVMLTIGKTGFWPPRPRRR
jgi:hypothetical protein